MAVQGKLLFPYHLFNKEKVMREKIRENLLNKGFTIVELLVTMSIFVIAIMLVSNLFINQLNLFRQQSAIVETNLEGIMGLEILRRDIETAGYGLPWNIPSGISYPATETFSANPCGSGASANPTTYNDNPPNPPRAIVSGNNLCFNGSDYLVIKSVVIAQNNTSRKWALLKNSGVLRPDISGEAFDSSDNGDRVIVIDLGTSESNYKSLVGSGSVFYKLYRDVGDFKPSDALLTRVIYGIASRDPKVPFNRADYFINSNNTPPRCAPGTGVLYKATMNHGSSSGTNQFTELPILDCVTDLQVIFGIDNNNDGNLDKYIDDISNYDANGIRENIKEVRVYILAQEGQRDMNYTYPHSTITVGEFGLGQTFDLSSKIGPDYKYYRWKLYKLVVKPNSLG